MTAIQRARKSYLKDFKMVGWNGKKTKKPPKKELKYALR